MYSIIFNNEKKTLSSNTNYRKDGSSDAGTFNTIIQLFCILSYHLSIFIFRCRAVFDWRVIFISIRVPKQALICNNLTMQQQYN